VNPRIEVVDTTGNPVWGVAWRTAELDGRLLVNLCNYRHDEVRIRLLRNGKPARYRAPDDTAWRTTAVALKSLETRLLVVE